MQRTDAANETLFPSFSHEGFLGFIEARRQSQVRPTTRSGKISQIALVQMQATARVNVPTSYRGSINTMTKHQAAEYVLGGVSES